MSFEGKIALVTGATRGMGAATAKQLADQGARVFTAQRGRAGFEDIVVDMADAQGLENAVDHIQSQAGKLDILVNNAGIMREGTITEMSLADWFDQLSVNLTAPFLLSRFAMPLLRKSGGRPFVPLAGTGVT